MSDTTADARPTLLQRLVSPSALTTVLAVLVALVLGGLLVAFADPDTQEALGYFGAWRARGCHGAIRKRRWRNSTGWKRCCLPCPI